MCHPISFNATCENHKCSRVRFCVTLRWYTVRRCTVDVNLNCCPCMYRQRSKQALGRGRGEVEWLPDVSLSVKNTYFHHGLTPVFSSQRTRNTRNIHVESGKAPSRRGKRNNVAHIPREVQWLFVALPPFPKTKDVRRSCSQRHRRVTGSADTHTVLSFTRKGTGPEMPGSVEPQLPSSMTHHVLPNVSQPREAIPQVRLLWQAHGRTRRHKGNTGTG